MSWLPGDEIAVEVAWGADLTGDPSSWAWTDITDDVRQDPGISITLGRGDEASTSQPASCSMLLTNASGDYSLGGQSANWPNVRQGTPVRVRVDPDNSGLVIAFQGAAVGFTPAWDLTGTIPVVTLEAAGVLRRLGQGQSPLASSLRRALSVDSTAVAYWPCEEGKGATSFAPAVGPYSMSWDAAPDLAANDEFASSLPIPVLKGSSWAGSVPAYTNTGELQVDFIGYFDDAANEAWPTDLLTIELANTAVGIVRLTFLGPGDLSLGFWTADNSPVGSATFDFSLDEEPKALRFTIRLEQNGANIDYTFGTVSATGVGGAGFGTGTIAGATLSPATIIKVNESAPTFAADEVAIGHIVVRNAITTTLAATDELTAYVGETATDRIERLCAENGELVEVIGTSVSTMGAQSVAPLLDLLRECETADGGVLLDGLGPGLTYVSRTERENRVTDLTVDAGAGKELAPPFAPVNDDQRIRNLAEVTRTGAGKFVHEDVTGPLGTAEIGTYDTSLTANVEDDGQAQHYAEWLVHLGTVEGYRYPELTFDLRATPALGPGVLALAPSSRVDVDDIEDTLSHHPGSGLSLLVEGLAHTLTGASWSTTAKCSSYEPWTVAQLTMPTYAVQTPVAAALAASANSTASDSVTPALPAHQPGDVLLIFAAVRNSGTGSIVTPDGWTALVTNGNCVLLGRVARENDTGPTIRAAAGATNETLMARAFVAQGVDRDLATAVHASATSSNVSAANITVPALTITEDNCLVLVLGWKQDDWTSVAALSGQLFSELFEDPSTLGSDAGIVVDWKVETTAANVTATSLVVTGGASAVGRSIVVALRRTPDPLLTRLDTDGSTLASSVSAGATSISVTTASGPLWTTTSTDYPFDLDIGGVRFHVTACADATSPQDMTISAAPVARSAGAPVKLWRPPVLAR